MMRSERLSETKLVTSNLSGLGVKVDMVLSTGKGQHENRKRQPLRTDVKVDSALRYFR